MTIYSPFAISLEISWMSSSRVALARKCTESRINIHHTIYTLNFDYFYIRPVSKSRAIMENTLITMNKLKFIDQTFVKPKRPALNQLSGIVKVMVNVTILNTIETKLQSKRFMY